MTELARERARMLAEKTATEYMEQHPYGGMMTFSALLHAMECTQSATIASLKSQAQIMRNTVKYYGGTPDLQADAETLEAAAEVLVKLQKEAGDEQCR